MFHFYLTQYNGNFLKYIAKGLGWVFALIYDFLSNFGVENAAVTIILFTILINLIMLPLTIKQQKFSKMQSKMQPEMSKIQEKYKNKKDNASVMAQQEEMKALYEKYGTSPAGGCLPMVVTLVVFFALYRVIYAIPAYVPQIYSVYDDVAQIAIEEYQQSASGQKSKEVDTALEYVLEKGAKLQITTVKWENEVDAKKLIANPNYIIDAFTKFSRADWFGEGDEKGLIDYISVNADKASAEKSAKKIIKINSIFGGLNLAEKPIQKVWPGVIIPIIAVLLQYLQTHLMMSKQNFNKEDPTAATMKTMNTFMPLMSGFFCLTFPTGNGIYLVSSSAFRIIQQFFVNKYMDNIDVDVMVEKNLEKSRKKRERLHLETSDGSIKNVANMKKASSVNEIAKMNTNSKNADNTNGNNKKYKKGSIASIAHMAEKDGEEN